MDKKGKFAEFFKKITDEQAALRRLPLYFLLMCVLLVVLIFKIGETNKKLEIIAENAGAYIEYETKSPDLLEIYSEETKSAEDYLFQFGSETESDITEENSTVDSHINETEGSTKEKITSAPNLDSNANTTIASTQNVQENTTVNNNNNSSRKTTYVINKSSKKIHKSNCSSVNQMKDSNKLVVTLTDAEHSDYLNNGYTACGKCGG